MKMFSIKPQIQIVASVDEFIEEFDISEETIFVVAIPYFRDLLVKKIRKQINTVVVSEYGSGEPSNELVEKILNDVDLEKYKRVVGIGGGTVLDISKLFTLKNITPVLDLYEKRIKPQKARELVLVPTTCGTGSEMTNISILELKERKTKLGLADDACYADYSVIILELVKTLPFGVFATSSIDAFIHCAEAYVSPNATEFSRLFSKQGMELIIKGYQEIREKGRDVFPILCEQFMIASCFGGIAFGNAGTGTVHAMSYPLSGAYHVPHGESNYVFFIEVFKTYSKLKPEGQIRLLNRFLAELLGCVEDEVYEKLERLFACIIQKKAMSDYGVSVEEIEGFTNNVVEKQGRLMKNAYVEFDKEQIREMFSRVL